MRREEGQTAAEYMGLLGLVAALVVVLVTASFGTHLRNAIIAAICRVAGGTTCTIENPGGDYDCILARDSRSIGAGVTIASAHVGAELRWDKVLRVNDFGEPVYDVTLAAQGDVAAQFGAGASVDIDRPGRDVGAGGRVEGSVGGRGRFTGTWRFRTQEEADQFIRDAEAYVQSQVISAAAGPVGGFVHRQFADADDWSPPKPPRARTVEGGVIGDVSGDLFGSEASAEGAAMVGATFFEDGTRVVYVDVSADAGLEAGIPGFSASANVKPKTIVALHYDKDGKLARLRVSASVAGVAAADLPGLSQEWMNPSGGLPSAGGTGSMRDQLAAAMREASVTVRGQGELSVETIINLDLTNPENRAAAEQYARALGSAHSNPSLLVEETGDLVGVLAENGTMTADVFAGSSTPFGFSAAGALGLKFGIEASHERSSSNHLIGWRWDNDSRSIVRRTDCFQR